MASYAELSRQSGINAQTIAARIHRGWPVELAITKQVQKHTDIRVQAELLGLRRDTVIGRVQRGMSREDALKPTRQYRKMDIEIVRKLAADGHKCIGIAHALGRSESYICTYCKKHKIKIGKQK